MKYLLDNTYTFSGDIVIRKGKVFECGLYKDKVKNGVAFSLSIEEADNAIAKFEPSDVGDEHVSGSWATGLLGKMQKVWRKGKEIFAEFHIPKALHELLNGAPVPVSTIWDEHKMLIGCDLTGDPRVTDAIMEYTFSKKAETTEDGELKDILITFAKEKHTTWHGQRSLQNIHDMSAQSGAICQEPDKETKMSSKPEMKSLQAIHDESVIAGAMCNQPSYYSNERKPMSFWNEMKTLFKKSGIKVEDEDEVVDPSGVVHTLEKVKVEDTAEFKASKSEADALKVELEALKAEKLVKFNKDNQDKITEYLTIGKLTKAEEAEALSDRAKNPELYDKQMLKVPIVAEFKKTISSDEAQDIDPNAKVKVTVKDNITNLKSSWM